MFQWLCRPATEDKPKKEKQQQKGHQKGQKQKPQQKTSSAEDIRVLRLEKASTRIPSRSTAKTG